MPYRATERTRAQQAEKRARILDAALELLSAGGYAAVQVAAVARHANVGTGTVYRYFPSKGDLFAEVFRQICDVEVALMRSGAAQGETFRERLLTVLEVFSTRALQSGRIAQALIAEPVDPAVDRERLRFRRAYIEIIACIIRGAQDEGTALQLEPELMAAFLVGGVAQALTSSRSTSPLEEIVDSIIRTAECAVFGGPV